MSTLYTALLDPIIRGDYLWAVLLVGFDQQYVRDVAYSAATHSIHLNRKKYQLLLSNEM